MAGILAVSRPGISMILESCAGISDSSKHQRLEVIGLPCNLVAPPSRLVWIVGQMMFLEREGSRCRGGLGSSVPTGVGTASCSFLQGPSLHSVRTLPWKILLCFMAGGVARSLCSLAACFRVELLNRMSAKSFFRECLAGVVRKNALRASSRVLEECL